MYTTAFGESHPAEARDFLGWIDANGHKLKPPVANTLMYGKGSFPPSPSINVTLRITCVSNPLRKRIHVA